MLQLTLLLAAPLTARAEDLIVLLHQRNCPGCRLADVDLMHADLRDADQQRAQLQRANLGQALLDGADLSGSDLSFTSMQGASLRGAKLHGAKLYCTDLRDADLTGAMLDPNTLEEAYWRRTKGMQPQSQSHAALHNAGVGAAESNRWNEAENLFGLAIRKQPDTAESWIARGRVREKLGQCQLAIQDFTYASDLYASKGATSQASQLQTAATSLKDKVNNHQSSNGVGSALLGGLFSTSQALPPLAMKLFMPAVDF